jgi:NDP-sugar pyrophosphorylase family protein
MRAVILAGGLGTRLRPLTDHTPKPIVPLGNRPFAEYQIDVLRRAGIEDICFSLGYQSEKIESVLGDGTDLGVRLSYVTEQAPLGTAGAFAFANRDSQDPVFVLNGDILTDVNLREMIEVHRREAAVATLFLKEVSDPTLYGLVETDGSGLVTGFREKPSNEEARKISHPLISAGIYLLEASVSRMIPSGVRFMFETDVFPSLIGKGARIASFSTTCYWRDIGTIENYRQGNLDSLRPPFSKHQENLIGCGCSIDESAELSTSVIGDRVALGGRSVVRGSVIHDDVSIGNDCVIEDTVIGRSCVVGDGSRLEPGTVLADETVI